MHLTFAYLNSLKNVNKHRLKSVKLLNPVLYQYVTCNVWINIQNVLLFHIVENGCQFLICTPPGNICM